MAKKTNPTPAKKAVKPVTNEEILEYLKVVRSNILRRINDIEDRLDPRMDKIERLLSTPQDVTGPPVTIPEQGLEPGDYTDASKEVADALTAMGWEWYSTYMDLAFFGSAEWENGTIINHKDKDVNLLSQAEFLSRAAVTAKALGLVAKEEVRAELSSKDAEIEALRNPWISVHDRLPENDDTVFVMLDYYQADMDGPDVVGLSSSGEYDTGSLVDGAVLADHFNDDDVDVTHWMPLPSQTKP